MKCAWSRLRRRRRRKRAARTAVELCADLLEGGITPSAGTIALARERLDIRLHVIIRPRGGDFCYSETEFAVMLRDIATAKALGADGVVIGVLQPDGAIDAARTAALIAAARPMRVTFHRAFDVTRDPFEALETLIALGVERVLTSGQEASALEGADLIAELVRRAGERIIVMPGGGIRERNVQKILAATARARIALHRRRERGKSDDFSQPAGVHGRGAAPPGIRDRRHGRGAGGGADSRHRRE